jgi:hypothetical protein
MNVAVCYSASRHEGFKMSLITVILPEPVPYYAMLDEDIYFTWLGSLPEVNSIIGTSRGLQVELSSRWSDDSLKALIALFSRFSLDAKEIRQFEMRYMHVAGAYSQDGRERSARVPFSPSREGELRAHLTTATVGQLLFSSSPNRPLWKCACSQERGIRPLGRDRYWYRHSTVVSRG